MGYVTLQKPLALAVWREIMQGVCSDCSLCDYRTTLEGPNPSVICARLREILKEFGSQGQSAIFAVHQCDVVGFWVYPSHNYVAITFSRTSADEFDGVMINSIAG